MVTSSMLSTHVASVIERFHQGEQVTNLCSVVVQGTEHLQVMSDVWKNIKANGDIQTVFADAAQEPMDEWMAKIRRIHRNSAYRILFIANADATPDLDRLSKLLVTLRQCELYSNCQPLVVVGFTDRRSVDARCLRAYNLIQL